MSNVSLWDESDVSFVGIEVKVPMSDDLCGSSSRDAGKTDDDLKTPPSALQHDLFPTNGLLFLICGNAFPNICEIWILIFKVLDERPTSYLLWQTCLSSTRVVSHDRNRIWVTAKLFRSSSMIRKGHI